MPAFHVARSTVINASPDRVFDAVADFNTWTTWSPWLIAEPDADVTVSDNADSVGSTYRWKGDVTGEGELEHLSLDAPKRIEDEIRFLKPFKSVSSVNFELQPEGDGTQLTWTMDGSMPWFMFWMIPMMKTFIGMDYSRGLKMLKEWIETGRIESKTEVHGTTGVGPIRMAGVRTTSPVENVGPAMTKAIEQCRSLFTKHGLPQDGRMMSVYHRMNMKAGTFEFTVGFELPDSASVPAGSGLNEWSLPLVQAFRVTHTGRYDHLGNGWSVANQIARYRKLKQSKVGAFEIYQPCAEGASEGEAVTDIYLPLR